MEPAKNAQEKRPRKKRAVNPLILTASQLRTLKEIAPKLAQTTASLKPREAALLLLWAAKTKPEEFDQIVKVREAVEGLKLDL